MSGWSDERVSLLKRLWAEGLSASQIEEEFGCIFSRNAIIGKIHRLGLSGRVTVKRKPQLPRPVTPVPVPIEVQPITPPLIEDAPEAEDTAPVSDAASRWAGAPQAVLDLAANQCRWPLGHPREPDFAFCPNTAIDGRPYCMDCHKLAYQPLGRARTVFVPQRRH